MPRGHACGAIVGEDVGGALLDEDGHDLGGGLLGRDLCRVVQQRHGDTDLLEPDLDSMVTLGEAAPRARSGRLLRCRRRRIGPETGSPALPLP